MKKQCKLGKHDIIMGGTIGDKVGETVYVKCRKCPYKYLSLESPNYKQTFTREEVIELMDRVNRFHQSRY